MDSKDYGGGYSDGFDGGMGYVGGCIPMDNVGFSGSEVIGNQLPSTDVSGETTADISYINEDVDTDLGDIKMPKMKFKQPKPMKPKATVSPARRSSSNHGGTISMVIGGLVGLGIFLIIYFTQIKD